jgi:hypothetical protein
MYSYFEVLSLDPNSVLNTYWSQLLVLYVSHMVYKVWEGYRRYKRLEVYRSLNIAGRKAQALALSP